MRRNFYLQHPLMAMCDPRMKNLLDKEGLKGIGAYWIIIEKLAVLPQSCGTLDYLRSYCKGTKISFRYLVKVICEHQLFDFLPDGSFIPSELNPPRNIQKEVEENKQKTAKSVQEKPVSETKNDEKQQKVSKQTSEILSNFQDKYLNTSELTNLRYNNTKENIKDIITTTTTESKETAAAADFPDETDETTNRHQWRMDTEHLHSAECFIGNYTPPQTDETAPQNNCGLKMACYIVPNDARRHPKPRISAGQMTHFGRANVRGSG